MSKTGLPEIFIDWSSKKNGPLSFNSTPSRDAGEWPTSMMHELLESLRTAWFLVYGGADDVTIIARKSHASETPRC